MQEALMKIVEDDTALLIPLLLFSIMGALGVIWIVFGTISSFAISKETEKSRREIAAYIAEGSMTPEDGERLLTVGQKKTNGKSRC